ncbi:hypothetical protein ACH4TX_13060 [Streptomyces sp. NPDC021098]|uniref:hypothetical protein n=1 Tax=unclassified Streptomyces TaxID=2593676 RepID=UPI0037A4E171
MAMLGAATATLAVIGATTVATAQPDTPPAQHHNTATKKELLLGTSRYLEALLANDPSKVPLAKNARATDLGNTVAVGKGALWGKATRFQQRETFADPSTGSTVFFGTAADKASHTWWWYELRLSFRGGKISEVEEIEYQAPDTGFGSEIKNAQALDPLLDAPVPRAERSSPRELIKVADQYWDSLGSTASDRGWKTPFSPSCQRREMGSFTTNGPDQLAGSCVGGFSDPDWRWKVDNRRYYVTDPDRGIVVGIGMFHTVNPSAPGVEGKSFAVPEIFKVENGTLVELVANFNPTGVQIKSGWPDQR